MDKLKLAQALVPIADELDEEGLFEESFELDEIIKELVSSVDSKMNKVSQADYTERQKDYRGIPMPQAGEDKQAWFNSLSAEDKAKVHTHFSNPWLTLGRGESQNAFNDLTLQKAQGIQGQQQQYQEGKDWKQFKFLGKDTVSGAPWYQDTTSGQYWYQDPQSKQWKSYNSLPGKR